MTLPNELTELLHGLPGEPLVLKGLADLATGIETDESLLLQIGGPRLRSLKIPVPESTNHDADHRLYYRLCSTHDNEAHSRYNSLLRQLSSFARALENRYSARSQQTPAQS